jgi:hypothetical protein
MIACMLGVVRGITDQKHVLSFKRLFDEGLDVGKFIVPHNNKLR